MGRRLDGEQRCGDPGGSDENRASRARGESTSPVCAPNDPLGTCRGDSSTAPITAPVMLVSARIQFSFARTTSSERDGIDRPLPPIDTGVESRMAREIPAERALTRGRIDEGLLRGSTTATRRVG